MKEKWIYFDMDGTIADLYGVDNWLNKLITEDPSPYMEATPMLNMSVLARKLHNLQKLNIKIGVVSWLSKNSSESYDAKVTEAKKKWLNTHLTSVSWDKILIVPYGTNKWELCKEGYLFDDEEKNHHDWLNGKAFFPKDIIKVLTEIQEAL